MAASTLGVSSRTGLVSLRPSSRPAAVPLARPAAPKLRVTPVVAFRDSKRAGSSSSKGGQATKGKKQPLVQPLGKVPTNKKEEGESIFWAIAVFGFFTTGLLFVTIPAFQVGGNSFTQTWQKGLNKSVGIKEPKIASPGYAPGPGPAAAPESPAAKM